MPGEPTLLEQRVFEILKGTFGPEAALLLMEYWGPRIPSDVARQRDVENIRLEVERTRAELLQEIEKVRQETQQMRAELLQEIERVRAELSQEVEKVRQETLRIRGELLRELERLRADLLKWNIGFWATQMLGLIGIILALVQLIRILPGS